MKAWIFILKILFLLFEVSPLIKSFVTKIYTEELEKYLRNIVHSFSTYFTFL